MYDVRQDAVMQRWWWSEDPGAEVAIAAVADDAHHYSAWLLGRNGAKHQAASSV